MRDESDGEAEASASASAAAPRPPSFRVSLCQRVESSQLRWLIADQAFADEWEPTEGPLRLCFTRFTRRQSAGATAVARARGSTTAPASVASKGSAPPTPAQSATPARGKKRGAPSEVPSAAATPSSARSTSSSAMHVDDDDLEGEGGGEGLLEGESDPYEEEEGEGREVDEEERKEGHSSGSAARRLDWAAGFDSNSSTTSAADGTAPRDGKRQRVQPIFHRQMRLQQHQTLGRVLLLGEADLDLKEDLLVDVPIGTPLRMRKWNQQGVQFETCAGVAGAAETVAREHALPKSMLGPCRLSADEAPTDWGALVHSLLFKSHGPILMSEARVHAGRTLRISLFLAEEQILSCVAADEEPQSQSAHPPPVDLSALETMHSEKITSRVAMRQFQAHARQSDTGRPD